MTGEKRGFCHKCGRELKSPRGKWCGYHHPRRKKGKRVKTASPRAGNGELTRGEVAEVFGHLVSVINRDFDPPHLAEEAVTAGMRSKSQGTQGAEELHIRIGGREVWIPADPGLLEALSVDAGTYLDVQLALEKRGAGMSLPIDPEDEETKNPEGTQI